jgi:hypothetical protein
MNSAGPISNLDAFDVVGVRKGGGVDLVISCSGPLDDGPATLTLLEQKVGNYLASVAHPNFPNVYPSASTGPVKLFISCGYTVSPKAQELIDSLTLRAAQIGVELSLVEYM